MYRWLIKVKIQVLSVDTPLIWEKVLVKFILATPIRKRSVLYAAPLARTTFMTGLIQKSNLWNSRTCLVLKKFGGDLWDLSRSWWFSFETKYLYLHFNKSSVHKRWKILFEDGGRSTILLSSGIALSHEERMNARSCKTERNIRLLLLYCWPVLY